MELVELAQIAADSRASDLFIKEFSPPTLRVDGKIVSLEGYPVLTATDTERLCRQLMNDEQVERFHHKHELDLAFDLPGQARFRVNIYQQRGSMGACLRVIPLKILSIQELGLPQVLYDVSRYRQGLVLVTGPTGSGKSTTLAAMIDVINQERRCNIVTVEEPIEFVHPDKSAIINQREVGIDTASFTDALKFVLRQSPDVILVGEMRDVETMTVALQAAETGHLVFSTVHTTSAADTMERIINMFPPHEKAQISLRMSQSLRAIVSQKLLPRIDVKGRIATVEVMVANPTISKLIEEGRSSQIYGAITEGGFWGMQTMNQCLNAYAKAGYISEEEAIANAGNVTELKQMLRRT